MSRWTKFRNVFRQDRLNAEFEEEMRFHVEARAAELAGSGVPEADARLRPGGRSVARYVTGKG
jgi:hypothetical protein